ncbi:hypothetical protein KY290_001341 [Solanum tuberosum]|uniref:Uncharacterized protein n=1 Tax=Solanum tuberosum TaxID=4113 RepID=A0ABQ7WLZ7_SOLTU|nr:hypothetical protein KY290_001341 [Solanum tuberosum]
MMCFNDRETPYPCFEIMDDKQNSRSKALILKVHSPVIGVFPLVRKPMDIPIHLTEWSMTETNDGMYNFSGKVVTEKVLLVKSSTHQNIVSSSSLCRDENLTSWHVPLSCLGEVCYMSGYWEWVKDVLALQQGGFGPQQNL